MTTRIGSIALAAMSGVLAQPTAQSDNTEPARDTAYRRDANPALSGQWKYENGVYSCDGYFTRSPAQAHCAAQPPDDWLAFEYQGNTYYIHRLSGGSSEQ